MQFLELPVWLQRSNQIDEILAHPESAVSCCRYSRDAGRDCESALVANASNESPKRSKASSLQQSSPRRERQLSLYPSTLVGTKSSLAFAMKHEQ
jgi:hypothetical protein